MAKTQVLNQVVAIEKGAKSRIYEAFTKLHQQSQKLELLTGFSKVYRPKDENGERLPSESKKVQGVAEKLIADMADLQRQLMDIEATKDNTNCFAQADIIVAGIKLVEKVPVTTLLFLEKQLTDWRTAIEKIPTLDPSDDWKFDEKQGYHKTDAVETHRTQKVPKPITLAPATEHHPAQTQLLSIDEVVGYWTTTKMSGALTVDGKAHLLFQANELLDAVKSAREQANMTPVQELNIGDKLFAFLLG